MTPKSPIGVRPVRVFTARSLTEANLAVSFLEESGIPARIEDAHMAEALGDAAKAFAKSAGIGVMAASDKSAAAAKALEKFERHKHKDAEEE